MPAVFVSHATANDDFISDLHDRLEVETGVEIWVDHQDIRPGEEWQVKIEQALYDCPCLIVALSRESVKRIEVMTEWRAALTYHHSVLPVIIDDVPVEDIPSRLRMNQWINLYANPDEGFRQLVGAIKGGGAVDGSGPRFTPWPILSRVPIERDLVRIPIQGRNGDLAEIKRLLADGPTAIVGVGGLGKSRLAAEIVMTVEGVGGSVWHRCGSGYSANDVLDLLRDHFGLPAAAPRSEILNHLRTHRRLIVFDNGESLAAGSDERRQYVQLIEELAAHNALVLITSRVEWNEIRPPRRKHMPEQLLPEDAARVVLEMANAYGLKTDLTAHADAIARAARRHPRLIEWAVRLMEHSLMDDVIADFEQLQGSDVEEALHEMIHKTFEQMVSTTPDGPTAAAALKGLVVCAGDFTQDAAQAITALERGDLRPALTTLQTYCFVTLDQVRQRYGVDPLVREVIAADEHAHGRLFDYYEALHGDHGANNDPDRYPLITDDFDNVLAAVYWGLKAVPKRACDFLIALQLYFDFQIAHELRGDLLQTALHAAQKVGYSGGEATTLEALGDLSVRRDEWEAAKVYYDRALPLYEIIGARQGQANTLKALGDLSVLRDELEAAQSYYDRALPLYEAIGDRLGQANTLKALGDLSVRRDEWEAAQGYYDAALPLYEAIEDRLGQANTLRVLGHFSMQRAEWGVAQGYYDRALLLYEAIGDRLGQANTLRALGDLSVQRDEWEAAQGYYDAALPIYEAIGDRLGQANTCASIGNLLNTQKLYDEAVVWYSCAVEMCHLIGDRYTKATTQAYLSASLLALGRIEDAIRILLSALISFVEIQDQSAIRIAVNRFRSLRQQIGSEAFNAAWQAITDEPLPDWLTEDS